MIAGYRHLFTPLLAPSKAPTLSNRSRPDTRINIVKTPTDGGIREDVPVKFKERYEKWKAELLSTEFGRQQWDYYANNKGFILTIKLSGKKDKGAGTENYLWDDMGNFVGATITLGDELNEGFPNPIYYPVLTRSPRMRRLTR